MKRLIGSFAAILTLCLALSLTVLAQDSSWSGEPLIQDRAGLLTEDQVTTLEEKAEAISTEYDCDTYVLTVNSLEGQGRREFAKEYYQEHNLGRGSFQNGILFLVAMDSREYVTITYGRDPEHSDSYGVGILAFSDSDIEYLENQVVPYLSDGDYSGAFDTYLDLCQQELLDYQQYGGGEVYTEGDPGYALGDTDYAPLPWWHYLSPVHIAIIIFVPLLIALIVCLIFLRQMKTARKATQAGAYVVKDSFSVTNAQDIFLRTDRQERYIAQDNDSGGSSVDSDGFGGSSGGTF